MSSFPQFKTTASTPGTDSNTYVLFSSTGYAERFFALSGISKFVLDLKHSHIGSLKSYKSDDRGTNWRQLSDDAISPASIGTTHAEFLVGAMRDWKLEWVNGGTAQSPWVVDMAGMDLPIEGGTVEPLKYTALGTATTANVKSGASRLFGIAANNRNAGVRYLQVFDSTGGTGTVLYQWPVGQTAATTPNGLVVGTDFFTEQGWTFATGLTWGMSTTAGSYVAATAAETDIAITYR